MDKFSIRDDIPLPLSVLAVNAVVNGERVLLVGEMLAKSDWYASYMELIHRLIGNSPTLE